MFTKDKVSIIIPTYNRDMFLNRCLNSLYEQTYRPLEIIIIDDGSKDKTYEVVQNFIRKFNANGFEIIYFFQNNNGAPSARNKGISESSGDWIQFLDSDDYLPNNKITNQIASLKKAKADLSLCKYKILNQKGLIEEVVENDGNLLFKVANGHSIFTGSALIGKNILKKGVYWNELLYREQDKEFLFKVIFLSDKYIYNSDTFANYIKHDQPQITDIYSKSNPQAIEVIKSNLKFFLQFKKNLSIYKFLLIINHIIHIILRLIIFYKFKKLIKQIFLK